MKSAAFAQNRVERGVKATVARRVDVETTDKTPDISTWKPWLGKLGEGRFWTTQDLGVLRQELFKRGIVPKVSLSGKQMDIKRLTINRDHKTIIQRVPDEWSWPDLYGTL